LNQDFFEAFIHEKRLGGVTFNQIDMSQKNIAAMPFETAPTLIISYQPYLSQLAVKGYKTVASTRDIRSFLVIDALFADDEVISGKEQEFVRLKEIFDKAVMHLKENPQEYYETVKGYLERQSYEEFITSTREIEWFDGGVPEEVTRHLERQNIKTDRLLP
jgi:NitT/TauT family transport system substrate-binding protein